MALQSQHKNEPMFNMSSMTDIVFLLLIFFMLTSNFVTPSGLPIDLPSSKNAAKVIPKIKVGITNTDEYFVGEKKVSFSDLEIEIQTALQKYDEGVVSIEADKKVQLERIVSVADIAYKLGAKVSIAVKPPGS